MNSRDFTRKRLGPVDRLILMEVRTTEVDSAFAGKLCLSPTLVPAAQSGCDGALHRIACMAADVFNVPYGCIVMRHASEPEEFVCSSDDAEWLRDYLEPITNEALARPVVYCAGASPGSDGAGIRSYVSVPLGPAADPIGAFCLLDFHERGFTEADVRLVESFASLAFGEIERRREIRSRIQIEEALRTSRDRAEEMNRLKSVFLSNMSHEIRTPLTTILGFAEILEHEVEIEEREFVRLIQKGGRRLMDTLMSILDLARLESSSFDIYLERFDVAKRVLETCSYLEPLATEKGLTLNVNIPEQPVDAVLDASAVDRTVANLIRNGIKFTTKGSVSVSVEVDDQDVLIHVADTGIGIATDFMPHIFEEFKQESEGLSRVHEGSGLGLPITKRLVELMKGKIMAESEKGRGSVFTVALPRNGEAIPGAQIPDRSVARPRVLVVEDNADTRTLVNHLLRKNYEVVCVSNGDEALARASELAFDVLLVDINLGKGKSGEDVLHDIKNLPGYADTPIVAVTAYAMPGDRERFFSEGFHDYVSKPFSKQRLLEALEGVLA